MRLLFLLILAIMLVPGAARAQFGDQAYQPTGFSGAGGLLRLPEVQKELKLTNEQVVKAIGVASDVLSKHSQALAGIQQLAHQERLAAANDIGRRVSDETLQKLGGALRADQVQRLREIVWQQRGLRHAEAQKALRLNEDQKGKFKTIIDATNKGTRELAKNLQPNFGEGVKKIRQLHKEAADKLVAALTDEQRQAWKKMTGAPFNLKLDPTYLVPE
jgi:hypothetical protein